MVELPLISAFIHVCH